MADINPTISIMTLNVNGLNNPKSEVGRVSKKYTQDPIIFSLQETYLRCNDTNGLKVKGWQKIYYTDSNHMEAGVTILISNKIDFKMIKKNVTGY